MTNRVVLAYSGGLKASVAIPWLIETHHVAVVAVALDLGQGEDLADIRQRALAAGALRCHVIDAREEFARDFVLPSLKAEALMDGRYPLATALARPLIAKTLVAMARVEGVTTVAHAGGGRDHMRLGDAIQALEAKLKVIACAEAWTFTNAELESVAERHQIPATEMGTHVDRNLCGRTSGRWCDAESSVLPASAFTLTQAPEHGPDEAATIEIEFARGVPIALNGVPMPPVELIESLSTIGAEHGVGRLDRVKARVDGRTSHAIYEAPAAVLLHAAHADLQESVAPGAVHRFAHTVSLAYADMIDRGEWFGDLRPALDAFVNHVQQHVTGIVRIKLFKGGLTTAVGSRQTANALSPP